MYTFRLCWWRRGESNPCPTFPLGQSCRSQCWRFSSWDRWSL